MESYLKSIKYNKILVCTKIEVFNLSVILGWKFKLEDLSSSYLYSESKSASACSKSLPSSKMQILTLGKNRPKSEIFICYPKQLFEFKIELYSLKRV